MLKQENGEDPTLERRLELMRIRNKQFDPMLRDLSTFIKSSYRVDKRQDQDFQSAKSTILPKYLSQNYSSKNQVQEKLRATKAQEKKNNSSTLFEIYDKLHELVVTDSAWSSINNSLAVMEKPEFSKGSDNPFDYKEHGQNEPLV